MESSEGIQGNMRPPGEMTCPRQCRDGIRNSPVLFPVYSFALLVKEMKRRGQEGRGGGHGAHLLLTNTSKIHLYVEQFSWKTNWRWAEEQFPGNQVIGLGPPPLPTPAKGCERKGRFASALHTTAWHMI